MLMDSPLSRRLMINLKAFGRAKLKHVIQEWSVITANTGRKSWRTQSVRSAFIARVLLWITLQTREK